MSLIRKLPELIIDNNEINILCKEVSTISFECLFIYASTIFVCKSSDTSKIISLYLFKHKIQ